MQHRQRQPASPRDNTCRHLVRIAAVAQEQFVGTHWLFVADTLIAPHGDQRTAVYWLHYG
jgi:hypothetical protein